MSDREKVISEIEKEIRLGEHWGEDCRMIDLPLLRDALVLLKEDCHNCKLECLLQKYDELKEKYDALLKEQEATIVIESENMYTGLPITHCPKCGKSLDRYLYGRRQEGEINFCPYCGQAVKWE